MLDEYVNIFTFDLKSSVHKGFVITSPEICKELNFLFEEKIVFRSQDILIFVFYVSRNFEIDDVIIGITAY